MTTADYKRKIAGLLAKAEATDNDHERDAFSAAAERLMLKMGINIADLESQGKAKAEDIVEVHRDWRTIYAPAMGSFTWNVANGFGNLTVLQSRFGKDTVRSYVIGHKSDVETFNTLMDSLHLQVMSAIKAYRKQHADLRRLNTIHENFVMDRSFMQAFGYTVSARLKSMRVEEEADVAPGTALVLASKQDRVDEKVAEMYPNMRKARATRSQYSSHGAAAGRAAGANASLGGKSLPGGRKAVR